jgi:glucose/arabinose dehydrogenase
MTQKLLVTALALSLFVPACGGSGPSSHRDGGADPDEDGETPEDEDAGDEPGGMGGTAGATMDGGSPAGGNPGGNGRDGGAAGGGGSDGSTAGRDAATVGRDAGPVSCDKAPSLANTKLETVVGGLNQLVYAAQPPGSSDWYLVEQGGTIREFSGGQLRAGNVLDLRSEVGPPKDGGDERGLLGLAFPPDFETSGLYYVMLTPRNGSVGNHDLVREYRRTDSGSTLVRTLLDLGESPENHNGGNVLFGPDNLLYIGTGDSGEGCGNMGLPQMLESRFGKILRLDPKQTNPSPAVVHYGLRNPFRFSFDRVSRDLFIGDVGDDRFEELDIAPAGSSLLNFGWPVFEANVTMNCGVSLRSGSTHTKPVLDFGRRNNGCTGQLCDWASIVGGVVYRGSALPQLYGAYIFADFGEEYVASFFHCSPTMRSAIATISRSTLGFSLVSGFVEDSDGELYFVADRAKLMKLVAK